MNCIRKSLMVILVTAGTATAVAEDWPQWRGKNRDAVLRETGLIETLPDGVLPRRWSVDIGAGYSGPTVAEGRVYVTDRGAADVTQEVERVLCFDADTGKELWNHTYESKYLIQYRAGPRASVTVHEGKAISVGAMGQLKCLGAASGELLWERDLAKDYKARMPTWGITASPLVYDDLVIQIAAGSNDSCVVAVDLETGKERWTALDERAGYAAPIIIRQGDQDIVVCWTGESVSGLNPKSGETLWRVPMESRNMPIGVATPVVKDDHLFVSSFYDGSMLIRIDPSAPKAEKIWWRIGINERNTDALHCMISTPILKGDHIYGVDSYGELRCLDVQSGDRIWTDQTAVLRDRWATIHIIQHGDREIMLNEQGQLIYATLNPGGYQEHSRCDLIAPTRKQLRRRAGAGVTWAHPAIVDGHIFARSDTELICSSLKAPH